MFSRGTKICLTIFILSFVSVYLFYFWVRGSHSGIEGIVFLYPFLILLIALAVTTCLFVFSVVYGVFGPSRLKPIPNFLLLMFVILVAVALDRANLFRLSLFFGLPIGLLAGFIGSVIRKS